MSKAITKNSTTKKPATKQPKVSTKAPAPSSDLAAVAVAEAVEGLGDLIEHTKTSESSSEKLCQDTSDSIIKGLMAQLDKTDVSDEKRNQIIKDVQAERERLFNKDSEIRSNNNVRLKMFLDFVFKMLVLVGGVTVLKEAIPLIKEAIASSKKS